MSIYKVISFLALSFLINLIQHTVLCTVPTVHYSHNMRILKLPRTTPVGSLIYRLKASAAQDSPLRFVAANGTDVDLIAIKSVDFYQANVYLNKPLQENEYNFTIYVTDGVERTLVDCQIVVKNGSQLMASSFIHFKPLLSVPESASFNSTIGYIHVKEKDNSNLPVTFEIEGSDCFGIRYIFGPKGTSKAEIFLKTQLDFERQNLFRLQVYALNAWTNETFDTRNIVMKELIITVINEQDTPPVFQRIPHLVQLTEATSEGDLLLTLNAIDGDQEQDRKIKYYLRQDDELRNHFVVDENSGEVTIKSPIDSIREIVGHENLFTLTFVAKEIEDQDKPTAATLTARKVDDHLDDHLISAVGLTADSDLPANEADSHNHYIVNDHFYDDESPVYSSKDLRNGQPFASSLTSDLLAADSRIVNDKIGNKADKMNNEAPDRTGSSRRVDKAENLANLQSINHMVLNRIPLKSTPINVPPLSPSLFRKRMLPLVGDNLDHSSNNLNNLNNLEHNSQSQTNKHTNPLRALINFTTTQIKGHDEDDPIFDKFTFSTTPASNIIATSTASHQPTTSHSISTIKATPSKPTNTAKPFSVTSKPMKIKQSSTTTTSRPATSPSIKMTLSSEPSSFKPSSFRPSSFRPFSSSAQPTIASVTIAKQSNSLLIANRKNASSQAKNVNLVNDNLVADEHYIVNNLTSIGLMDENFRPENLMETLESSAENNRLNNERATAMNAVLSELSGTSKTETEITVGFIILQISNHAPDFPLVKPNFTNSNSNDEFFIMNGQIEENSKPNSIVQLEQELLIQDQDHGLNGTFDVQIVDQTKIFDIQPKTGYRNQTFQILVINSNQLRMMENRQINLRIIVTDRSPFKSLKNELTLSIRILSTNDNFPQFNKDLFKATINEKEQVGTIITRISAVDSDEGDFGQVTYSHLLGDLSENLKLNPLTGEITLISLDNIDREKQDFYTLIIYVCDNFCKPEESNSNQTLLEIEILDANDNRPEFVVPRYDFLLNSNLISFSSPIQVVAKDADEENTPNSNVTYEIISGNLQNKFKIDKVTGEIQLSAPLSLEGIETLPIGDLENDQAGNSLDADEDGVVERNRIIDYPWTENNFDLAHLDSLFSYFSPIINLTVRAHDQGIPILDNFINVYIHCQNYINRTAVFIVNDNEQTVTRKKAEYERQLSEMASGRVRIKTIQTPPAQTNLPNRTLVYSTITYPSQSVVDVNKVNWYSSKIIGTPPNILNVPGGWFNLTGINRQGRNQLDTHTHSVKTAGLDNNSFITWLLIMIILITLIFLLILIAIWCYFCGCRKRKNKINSADSDNYYSRHLKAQQMNRQLLKHQQLENDSIDSQQAEYGQKTDVKQLMANGKQMSATQQARFAASNYQMSEFDAAAFNRGFKKRIKPGSAAFDNSGYVSSDLDPSGNFILTARKARSAPESSSGQRAYVDETGVFTSNKVNYDKVIDEQQSGPLDLYNEDAYSILNRVWFGERGEKREVNQQQQTATDQKEDPNDLYATVRRNKVKFTDERAKLEGESSSEEVNGRRLSQDETSVKHLQDKHRTASQLTLRSQVDQIGSNDSKDLDQDTQSESVSRIPKAILKNTDKQRSSNVSPSSDTDSGIGHKGDATANNKDSSKDKESIKTTNNKDQLQAPPQPPPLPLTSQQLQHHITQKLHLKNEDVAQKKSVFTIAYNGVKTDRLNSADSSIYI